MAEKNTVNNELVDLFIPEDYTNRQSQYIVLSVNGKKLKLERGITHQVPREYAEMYADKQKFRKSGEKFKRRNALK